MIEWVLFIFFPFIALFNFNFTLADFIKLQIRRYEQKIADNYLIPLFLLVCSMRYALWANRKNMPNVH